MSDPVLNCPECGAEIHLSENLAGPLLAEERRRTAERLKAKDAEIAAEKARLAEEKRELDRQVEQRLEAERKQMAERERKRAMEATAHELAEKSREAEEMRQQMAAMDAKLAAAQNEQAQILKQRRALEDEKRELELTVEKRLAKEAELIRQKTRAEIATEHALKEREKEQQIAAMRKQIDDLKRKAEQGSQQHQGEVLETALEDMLRQRFPYDEIVEIKKGQSGADVLQKVMSPNGKFCGSILWETKRTKAWSGSWIPKLKNDQRNCGAEIAVILSTTLPKEMNPGTFSQIDGVWVTAYETAMSMVGALRMGLIDMNNVMAVRDGQASKAEEIYDYLTGTRFKHRIEAIVEKFSLMRDDLEREKKVMVKNWAKREGQIDAVIRATLGMRGDLEAIAGKAMPEIDGLDDDTPLIEEF